MECGGRVPEARVELVKGPEHQWPFMSGGGYARVCMAVSFPLPSIVPVAIDDLFFSV